MEEKESQNKAPDLRDCVTRIILCFFKMFSSSNSLMLIELMHKSMLLVLEPDYDIVAKTSSKKERSCLGAVVMVVGSTAWVLHYPKDSNQYPT